MPKPPRLVPGDYFPDAQGHPDAAASRARDLFIEALPKYAPDAVQELIQGVFPLFDAEYRRLAPAADLALDNEPEQHPGPIKLPKKLSSEEWTRRFGGDDQKRHVAARDVWDTEALATASPEHNATLVPLREVLSAWTEKWNLLEDWIVRSIAFQMWQWATKGEKVGHFFTSPEVHRWQLREARQALVDLPRLLTLNLPSWSPLDETWEEYARESDRALKALLTEHRTQALEAVQEAGLKKAYERRQLEEHISWLVAHQVRGQSCAQLSKDLIHDRRTIEQAVRAAAEMLGIELRPRKKAGRPRLKS
jgi:hypothetical protein